MTFLSINGMTIRANAKAIKQDPPGRLDPPIRIAKTIRAKPEYASEVSILDAAGQEVARLVYDPHGAIMPCGARMVLEMHHGHRITS